jgi:hypothetical protein
MYFFKLVISSVRIYFFQPCVERLKTRSWQQPYVSQCVPTLARTRAGPCALCALSIKSKSAGELLLIRTTGGICKKKNSKMRSIASSSSSSSREIEKLLQPVYSALERRNYNRAIKLCSDKQLATRPIAIALRAHALERSGRSEEALRTVEEELLGSTTTAGKHWEDCETTISVMAVTLESCHRYDTLAQVYLRAVEAGERRARPPPDLREFHQKNLIGLFTAHLRLALQIRRTPPQQQQHVRDWMTLKLDLSPKPLFTTSTSDNDNNNNNITTKSHTKRQCDALQHMANCFEAMQAAAMKLARTFSSSNSNIDRESGTIYWSWTVFSILLHCEALQQLLVLHLEETSSSREQINLLRQKSEMLLPKLAESLCQTKILTNKSQVSGEEW